MKDNIVSSHTYNPEHESLRLEKLSPRDRHEHMLEQHRQKRATRQENHRRGIHRMRFPAGSLK